MTRAVAEAIADTGRRSQPVVRLEDGQVWVSGMNAEPWGRARRIADRLEAAGFDTGEVTDDRAAEHGGLLIPVDGCEPVSDDVHQEVFGDA